MKPAARRFSVPFLLVLFTLGLTACSTRDHDNPLDPKNPDTGGEPEWLDALADDEAVDLSWSVRLFQDIEEVQLVDVRSDTVLWSGGLGSGEFRHRGLPNEQDFLYRLDLVLTTGRVTRLPEEIATPGSEVPWIYDLGSASASRLTPDGRRVRLRVPDPSTLSVVADPDSAFVLLVNFFAAEVVLLDRGGEELWVVEDLLRPTAGLWSPEGWWVSDAGLGAVLLYDHEGRFLYGDSTLTFPQDLAVAGPGAVWSVDRQGLVVRIERDLGVTAADTLVQPFTLAETGDGGIWVADRGSGDLVRLDASATEIQRVPFAGVEALAADPVTEGVWVADRAVGRVVRTDERGQVVTSVGGFPSPASLSVSPAGTEIWVADPARGRIIRLNRNGDELSESFGVSTPVSVSVAFAPTF
jgi:streptogramin lyase